MANPAESIPGDSDGRQDSLSAEGRERGTRRRKLAGYLKAANELRQSYQQSYAPGWAQRDVDADENDQGIPGAFPDVAIVRNGDEEMMLFPSYARRHVKRMAPEPHESRGADQGVEHEGPGDAEAWKKEWERHEDNNAIVDVDVRGWIYSPHRGAMTRKNRLLIGIARRLSGMPAPSDVASDENQQSHDMASRAARKEEELVLREAESIAKRGDGEADVAWRGGYSEEPYDSDRGSVSREHSRASTPGLSAEEGRPSLRKSTASLESSPGRILKRASWNQPSDMSDAELRIANAHLMARLKPFLSVPQANIPITVFFYDDETSQSRTILTDEAGHFSVRAALDFVPTDVRVLASEGLSATEEVRITEPTGVSLISDIDDTIKHSAVGSGAREIFRNTFIRELGDLTIEGVKDWYRQMADMGVKIHYVSNSPWQLFPLLSSYFALAGLPPGSFHLKQYSGMLQGIFEPVAERKKGTLEKIMRDFPERKFLLVGDSGEADLEVYTDVVLSNPKRILGVFIRDITTPVSQGFFDSAMGPLSGERHSKDHVKDSRDQARDSKDESRGGPGADEKRPALPARPDSAADAGPRMGTLIDFDTGPVEERGDSKRKTPPQRPAKPMALQSPVQDKSAFIGEPKNEETRERPPVPRKPPQYSKGQPPAPSTSDDYRGSLRQKVSSAYNSMPSASSYLYGETVDQARPGNDDRTLSSPHVNERGPAPARRNLSAYPAAAAQYASSRIAAGWAPTEARPDDSQAQINKKEDVWKRRWARAKQIMEENDVELRSWRVGVDVMGDAVELVKKSIPREMHEK